MKIIKPTIGKHDGSSFRELLDIWSRLKLCEVVDNKDNFTLSSFSDETQCPDARPWINEVGDILLYDNPILDKLHSKLSWNFGLFANSVFKCSKSSTWTFWPKHPKIFKELADNPRLTFDNRKLESIFIGTATTGERFKHDWSKAGIEFYWMGSHSARLYDHRTYLNALHKSKFGLCLPGVGPKCLRDIELVGLGTVPIFTPGVSTDYYKPLIKDQHFLYAESPEQVEALIKTTSKKRWEEMSHECIDWYENNASPVGAYNITCEILTANKLRY
jgi:hypothetical protein